MTSLLTYKYETDGRGGFFQRNGKKCLIPLLGVVGAAVVLVPMITFLILWTKDTGDEHALKLYSSKGSKVCETKGCKVAAEYIKSNMNRSADPCNDFFNYVCGRWAENNKKCVQENNESTVFDIEENKMINEMIDLLNSSEFATYLPMLSMKQAQGFFKACTNKNESKEYEGIKKVVADFGGFPMYDLKTYNRSMPWYVRSAKVIRQFGLYGRSTLTVCGFEQAVIVNVDVKPFKNYIALIKPKLYAKNSSHYRDPNYSKMVKNSVCNVLKNTCNEKESHDITKHLEKLIEFQVKMAEFVSTEDTEINETTVGDVEKIYPDLHVFAFLKELFVNYESALSENTVVILESPKYWHSVNQLIKNTNQETIDNLIGWKNFQLLGYTTSREITPKPFTCLDTETDADKKKKFCFLMTDRVFELAFSFLFASKFIDDVATETVTSAVQAVRKSLIQIIRKTKWLDNDTMAEAISKIEFLSIYVGYPVWLKNILKISYYYQNAFTEETLNSTVIQLFQSVLSYKTNEVLLQFTYSYDNKGLPWVFPARPHDFNALYIQHLNAIVIPATQCIRPFFWADATKALSFGGTVVVSHEITHAIGPIGAKKDAYGNSRNWWSAKSMHSFKKRTSCMIKQYSETLDPITNEYLNGSMTVGEDVADNGAWRIAYQAYLMSGPKDERLPGLEDLSDKKLFFITAGMTFCGHYTQKGMRDYIHFASHSPHIYRVPIPPSNMPEFSEVFNCPEGSKMNRKQKCVVW